MLSLNSKSMDDEEYHGDLDVEVDVFILWYEDSKVQQSAAEYAHRYAWKQS